MQHALRAYTPAEQKAVRAAAQTMRPNPRFKTEDVIMELGVGEALTSFLDEEGVPGMVQRTSIICPQSLMAPADEETRRLLMSRDGMAKYDTVLDPLSAYEELTGDYPEEIGVAEDEGAAHGDEGAFDDRESAVKRRQRAWEAEKKAKEEAESERKKREKEEENARKKREKAAERRKAQIERQLINTGMQVLKRGLMNTLFK